MHELLRDVDNYEELYKQAVRLFTSKGGTTAFHKILIERVISSYTVARQVEGASEKEVKVANDTLQRWLTIAFNELHSSEKELQDRREFIRSVLDVLDNHITDIELKKRIFLDLKSLVGG